MLSAAFYGDSVVTGWRGISAPEQRWSSLVCAELGWQELNLAVNGLGFVRWRGPDRAHSVTHLGELADVLACPAQVCVVALGVNDSLLVHKRRDDVRAGVGRDLDLLLERFGRDRVVVMDLYSPFANERPPGWRAVRVLLQEAVTARGLQLVPGLQDTIAGDPALLCEDLVHPNDAGHAALAHAVTPHLRRAFHVTTPSSATPSMVSTPTATR